MNETQQTTDAEQTSKRNRLWGMGFPISVTVTLLSISMQFGLMLGLWTCVAPNLLCIFSIVSLILLGFSFYFYRRNDVISATVYAFVPIFGQVAYIILNLVHPDGCGLWFLIGRW